MHSHSWKVTILICGRTEHSQVVRKYFFSETLNLNHRPVLPNHGARHVMQCKAVFSWYMAHHRPFLRGNLDGQPSTEWRASQKNSYEILIQMAYCHFWMLPPHPRHMHTRVINYQSMGITLLLTAHLALSQGTWVEGRAAKKSHLRHEFHRGVLSSP